MLSQGKTRWMQVKYCILDLSPVHRTAAGPSCQLQIVTLLYLVLSCSTAEAGGPVVGGSIPAAQAEA